MTPAQLSFALHKAPLTVEYAIGNVRSLGERPLPHADRLGAKSVLIVGAGPTLDLGRVREAADAGVSIWTVNTAARAVCSVVAPDVVVVRESLDVSAHFDDLRHRPHHIVCDVHAHPKVWTRATSFFVPAQLQSFAVGACLDVAPVYAGTASLTAAVALAVAGGAEWIGLEGVDLAYGRDGAGYSSGARYASSIARVDNATGIASLIGGNAQRELAERSGQHWAGNEQRVVLVHAADGASPLHALPTWLDQIEWLERLAVRMPHLVLDRGHGLAELVGWSDTRASRVRPSSMLSVESHAIGGDRVASFLADVERQVGLATTLATSVPSGVDPTQLPSLVLGCPLLDAHAAGRMMLARDGGFEDGVRGIYEALQHSAISLRPPDSAPS